MELPFETRGSGPLQLSAALPSFSWWQFPVDSPADAALAPRPATTAAAKNGAQVHELLGQSLPSPLCESSQTRPRSVGIYVPGGVQVKPFAQAATAQTPTLPRYNASFFGDPASSSVSAAATAPAASPVPLTSSAAAAGPSESRARADAGSPSGAADCGLGSIPSSSSTSAAASNGLAPSRNSPFVPADSDDVISPGRQGRRDPPRARSRP
jgi:hypothetical protein